MESNSDCILPNITIVVGAPRSGTTLLDGLLCAGENSYPMLPECTYITQIINHYHDFLNYSDPQRFAAYAIDEVTLSGMYERMVKDMLATVFSHFKGMPYQNLVLKDPMLTLLIDLIPKFFGSQSKVVYIVRDPRSVIASMLKVEQLKKRALTNEEIPPLNGKSSSEWFKNLASEIFNFYWRAHSAQLFKDGMVHTVRFENIVSRDDAEFKSIEQFLGYSIGREGFGKVYFDFDRHDATFSENYGKAIQVPVSDFRKVLNNGQISEIEAMFAGYNLTYKWW